MAPLGIAMEHRPAAGQGARWLNVLLGVWLLASAFLWRHSQASQSNTWMVGALIIISAVSALYDPRLRWATLVLSVWLGLSSLWLAILPPMSGPEPSVATMWNNLVVAILVFVFSLPPTQTVQSTRRPGRLRPT